MKKYIISTLTAAAALATPAFAADLLPTLENATRISGSITGWEQDIGRPGSITTDIVSANYGTGAISGTGWYWGLGNLSSSSDYNNDFSISSETSFSYAGRYNFAGEFVIATVELSDLLSTDELLSGFSISFTMTTSADNANDGFHIYYVDTTTGDAVEFTSDAYTGSGTGSYNYSYTWDASDSDMDGLSSDYALIFVWNSDGTSGAGVSITDLSSSYTVTPEPSMFGVFFGLGAIGLVATRRRRRA